MYKYRQTKGFTLIELLVVISIIAVLSSVVLANLQSAREDARISSRVQTMREIRTALESYNLESGEYPTTVPGVQKYVTTQNDTFQLTLITLVEEGYISSLPEYTESPHILYAGPDYRAWRCSDETKEESTYKLVIGPVPANQLMSLPHLMINDKSHTRYKCLPSLN